MVQRKPLMLAGVYNLGMSFVSDLCFKPQSVPRAVYFLLTLMPSETVRQTEVHRVYNQYTQNNSNKKTTASERKHYVNLKPHKQLKMDVYHHG